MNKSSIIVAVLMLALAGCSSAPMQQTHYLIAAPTAAVLATDDAPLLEVDIEIAEHLNRPGISYLKDGNTQINAKQHRWAQPLQQQLQQQLVQRLRQKQQRYWPMGTTATVAQSEKQQLIVRFYAFSGSYNGSAQLSGEWLLVDAEGKVQRNREFALAQPLQSEGYPALVDAFAQGVDKLAESISDGL